MTTKTSAWVPSATAASRMQLEVNWYVPAPTSPSQTTVTVTGTFYIVAGSKAIVDSSAALSWAGSLLGSGSLNVYINVPARGRQHLHAFSKVVTLTDAAQGFSLGAALTGVNPVGASYVASVNSQTVSVPAKVLAKPAKPSPFTRTDLSGLRHRLNFGVGSGGGVTQNFTIRRFSANKNAWQTLRTVPATVNSLIVSYENNDRYQYAIRALNRSQASDWVYLPASSTTPAAASNVTLRRVGAAVRASWKINAKHGVSQTLQNSESSDGGTTWSPWTDIAGHVKFGATTTSRDITTLDELKLQRVRVITYVNSTPSELSATSQPSAAINLIVKPNPPTVLAPNTNQADSRPTWFKWRHNPLDSSDQTAYQVEYTKSGDAPVTLTGTSTNVEQVSATLTTGDYSARIRTKGAHVDWSNWSNVIYFSVLEPPTVTIDSPQPFDTVSTNRAVANISYYDPQGSAMTAWRGELRLGAESLETITGKGAVSKITFKKLLDDSLAYTMIVTVTAGTGVTSDPDEVTFNTFFVRPPKPVLTAAWEDITGSVSLGVVNPAPTGTDPAAVSNRIEYAVDRQDGTPLEWLVLADDVDINTGADHGMVDLGINIHYIAYAIAPLGVETASDEVIVTTEANGSWFNTSDGRVFCFEMVTSLDTEYPHDVILEEYIGDELPTPHFGEKKGVTNLSINGTLVEGYGLSTDWRALFGAPVYYRDYQNSFWAVVSPAGISKQQSMFHMASMNLQIVRVMHD